MIIHSDRCGREIGESTVSVDTRRLMAYAAGIGAERSVYLSDDHQGGIIAPPAFIVSLEWVLLNGPQYRSVLGADEQTMHASVHVLQDSSFHRPIRPQDRLTTRGRIVGIRPTSAGALVTSELHTVEAGSGELVAQSYFGAIFLRVDVAGAETTILEPPPLRGPEPIGEAAAFRRSMKIARTLPHCYTECAGIWNPIHTERQEATLAKLPDIILHGTCTWALASELVIDAHAGCDPTRLKRMAGRFHGMVIPGTSVTFGSVTSDNRGAVAYEVTNARGELAIKGGTALVDAA